jgi:outer membrane receptor protein involved in Fe transport
MLGCSLASMLTAASGQTLRGTVRDPSGATVGGAHVVLDQARGRSELITGRDGTFIFPDVARGAKIAVEAAGFSPVTQLLDAPGEPLEIVLHLLPLTQEIVVTPQRSAVPVTATDAAVVRFSAETLQDSGGATLDDKLREVPGFSLLRRTSSRAANPTTQGASLRGLAASGASRVLVLDDAVPLNDPFGGWVFWDRVPAEAIESVEVMQGGASHLYGSGALAGVVNVLPRQATDEISGDFNVGNEETPHGSFAAAHSFGPWVLSGDADGMRTSGYIAVRPPDRGMVDAPLTLRYATGDARIERRLEHGEVFSSISLFNEGRGNGTPLQVNSTRLGEWRLGLDADAGPGRVQLRGFAGAQRYVQTFSSIAADRSRETLTSWQRVPAQQEGGSAQWTGIASGQAIAIGTEVREMRGVSNDIAFSRGTATPSAAGGRQTLFGAYATDSLRIRRLTLTAGARLDRWSNRPLNGSGARDGVAFSPHLGAVLRLGAGFSWTVSSYRSFRAPTLNELYRNFRVGNILTLANPALGPESLVGGESGLGFARANLRARADFFWDEVTRPVANTTLSTTPQLITRQRENLGSLRSRGLELSLESRLPRHFSVRGAYQFVDATVLTSPGTPVLVGNLIPQVPRHGMSAAVAFADARWTISAQARAAGRQFDDDQNLLPLDRMFDLDGFVSRRMSSALELYVAAENLLDQRAMVGRTPTPTFGSPILFRGGARLHWGK